MKKLIVLGDSFANYEWVNRDSEGWAGYISEILNIPLINFGISGSATNYSFDKFIKYTKSTEYDPEDIIIFVPSGDQRIYTENMYNPRLGIFYSYDFEDKWQVEKDWAKNNLESAIWTVDNLLDGKINYEFIKTISFLSQWAHQNKTNRLFIIRAFVPLDNGEDIEKLTELITPLENFFPLLNHNTSLGVISVAEFKDNSLLTYSQSKNKGADFRINHLSKENRLILADIISQILSTSDISLFKKELFIKHIYKTKDDIDRYMVDYF